MMIESDRYGLAVSYAVASIVAGLAGDLAGDRSSSDGPGSQ